LIRPVLFYGSKTWELTKREENQLLVFERKVLRPISCPKIENGVYRTRYNHELDKEFNSSNALKTRYPEDPKTYQPSPMEGKIKEDQNLGGRMG
jgi:hypothetical protein